MKILNYTDKNILWDFYGRQEFNRTFRLFWFSGSVDARVRPCHQYVCPGKRRHVGGLGEVQYSTYFCWFTVQMLMLVFEHQGIAAWGFDEHQTCAHFGYDSSTLPIIVPHYRALPWNNGLYCKASTSRCVTIREVQFILFESNLHYNLLILFFLTSGPNCTCI